MKLRKRIIYNKQSCIKIDSEVFFKKLCERIVLLGMVD